MLFSTWRQRPDVCSPALLGYHYLQVTTATRAQGEQNKDEAILGLLALMRFNP